MRFCFLFTTGRSGTGFLSQVFGHGKWEKRTLHSVDGKHFSMHEGWNDIPVEKMKETDLYSQEAKEIGITYINRRLAEVREEHPEAETLFVTDHKIGGYFGPSIAESGMDFRVVYVERSEHEVVESFVRKAREKRAELDDKRYNRFLERIWTANKYHPSDKFVKKGPSKEEWARTAERDRYRWYHQQVRKQWSEFKQVLKPEQFLEIRFDDKVSREQLD